MKPIAIRLFRLIDLCAVVMADSLGQTRYLTVQEDGDMYVADFMRGQIGRILYTGRSD